MSNSFPVGFKWGVASSAYQTEGGHDAEGRGPSIWDKFCHENSKNIEDGSNGDITCDSYHKYKEDVQLIRNMAAQVYRFSISWSRILPNGTKSVINASGIDFYNRLIDELIENGIDPMVTLFHWDTPAQLEGDWLNEEIIEHFTDYCRICFQHFGDRVKNWITFNEPHVYAVFGFTDGTHAPGIKEPMTSSYVCAHNQLKAHALTYHIYSHEFKQSQMGRVGISLDGDWFGPLDKDSKEDCAATERAFQFRLGWFGHPIFKGDYPEVMKEYVWRRSQEEGRQKSRLPQFNDEWVKKIKGTADFLGINNYTSRLVKHSPSNITQVGHIFDHDVEHVLDPSWTVSNGTSWLYHVPSGLRRLINWVSKEYNVEIIITENGLGTADSDIEDTERIDYYTAYIREVLKAVVLDGNNVTGYIAWCLMDNFEWSCGFGPKFGVHAVDFNSPERTRVPRASAKFLAKLFKQNRLENDKSV